MLNVLVSMVALLSGVIVLGLANSLMFTLLGIRMSIDGVSGQMIGVVGSAYFAGMLAGTVFCSRVIRRVGHIRAFTAFAAVSAIAALLHVLIDPVWVWAFLRVAMGFSSAGLFMVAESWLQYKATNETRGRTFALYAVAGGIGAGGGPLLVNLGDPAGFELFVIASILLSLCLLPVALTRVGNPDLGAAGRFGIRDLFAVSPVAVAGAVAAGLVSGATATLGAVFGERIGLTAVAISLLMTAMRMGGFVMQYPIGALSDRFDRRRVMIVLCLGTAAAAALFAVVDPALPVLILLLGLLFGGLNQPIYGLVVSHAYDYVQRRDFVAASAGLLFAYGIGASLGPSLAAPLMDAAGPAGLFLYATVVLMAFAAFVAYRMRRRAPVPTADQADFVVVPATMPAAATRLDPRVMAEKEKTGEDADENGKNAEDEEIRRELDQIRWS